MRFLLCVVLILCFCGAVAAQDSVMVPSPAQTPDQQVAPPVVVQPQVVASPVFAGPQPVWIIKKKFFGYRAKPAWLNMGYPAPPPIMQPVTQTVMVPTQVTTYVVRQPQPVVVVRPHVQYSTEIQWRY